jgi:phage terminase Nu1 subunit (DNA packaging protein)
MTRYVQSDETKKLKLVQIELKEIELQRLKGSLVYRDVVQAQMVRNGAKVKNIFASLASRIRQELGLTLDQMDAIDRVIDQVMVEYLNRHDDEDGTADAALLKPKRVRRLPAAAKAN